jgi:hypothetical protein
MTEASTALDQDDADLLSHDLPDEALEAAAGAQRDTAPALTIAYCTGNLDCPF